MTSPTFQTQKGIIAQRWEAMQIGPAKLRLADNVAARLLTHKANYLQAQNATSVPVAVIAAIHERECSANFACHFHNGDSLQAVTHHVPAGRLPPPARPPFTWLQSVKDALAIDRLDQIAHTPEGWSIINALWQTEIYNGVGYAKRGLPSAYVFAGSDQYQKGKYTSDGRFDPDHPDEQLGTAVLIARLCAADPSLKFWPGTLPAGHPANPKTDAPVTRALRDGDYGTTMWVQKALNRLKVTDKPIDEDGIYGGQTKAAVREFQDREDLQMDGKAGPITCAEIKKALDALPAGA